MKLSIGFALSAAAGLAIANNSDAADVYLIRDTPSTQTKTPSLARQVARLIFTQRLASPSEIGNLPESLDTEEAIRYINQYGKRPQPLFGEQSEEPAQLVIMMEGATTDLTKKLHRHRATSNPAFSIEDAPSSVAHQALASKTLYGDVNDKKCTLDKAIDPAQKNCWNGKEKVLIYDIVKHSSVAKQLIANLDKLEKLAQEKKLETTLVLLPESSRASKVSSWASTADELRKRQFKNEQVMTDEPSKPSQSEVADKENLESGGFFNIWSSPSEAAVANKSVHIPSCFQSFNSCMTTTGGCSNHGNCTNKFGADSKNSCWSCKCGRTSTKGTEQTTPWGGAACDKQDVSVPFWLLTGFTFVMIAVVGFCISLLYSVGEEKLPGVIGAGVSRPSK